MYCLLWLSLGYFPSFSLAYWVMLHNIRGRIRGQRKLMSTSCVNFWLTWKVWVYVMISVRPAVLVVVRRGKNIDVAKFLDTNTINVINVKLCVMILLIELYVFLHFWWNWPYFEVTAVSNSMNGKFYVLIWLSWNFRGLKSMSSRTWIQHLFWWLHIFKEDN